MKATIKNIETGDLLIEEIQFEGSIGELKDFFVEMGIVMPKIYRKENGDDPGPLEDEWGDCKKEDDAVEPSNDSAGEIDDSDKIPIALCGLEKLTGVDKITDLPHVSAIICGVDGNATKVDVTWGDTKKIGPAAAIEKLWDFLRRSVMSGTTKSIDKAFVAANNTLYIKMARACNVKGVANDACNRVEGFFDLRNVECVTFISDGEMPTRV